MQREAKWILIILAYKFHNQKLRLNWLYQPLNRNHNALLIYQFMCSMTWMQFHMFRRVLFMLQASCSWFSIRLSHWWDEEVRRNYRENFTPSSSAEESKLFPCVLAVPGLALGPYSPSHEALRERKLLTLQQMCGYV